MKRFWLALFIGATCQAVQPVIGNMSVYPDISYQQQSCAQPFTMPVDGTIKSISMYHEGGSGEMLLGVYLGDTAPSVRVDITAKTMVNPYEGWQTIVLRDPLWIPEGTQIWFAWLFEHNPGIRTQTAVAGSIESEEDWNSEMPNQFGNCQQSNHTYSIYATYIGDEHLVINEVMLRNDAFSERRFLDEDWLKQAWIELYNPSDVSIDLKNYYLSNNRDDLQMWAFPDMVIGPQEFLRVWGSGKDHRNPQEELHTSFNLMDSENIYLTYSTTGDMIDRLEDVKVPTDYSYGRYPDGSNDWYFYTQPTPKSANAMENGKPFVIDRRHVSLTVGTRCQLTVTPQDEKVIWSSDNPLVWVDPTGGLLAVEDAVGDDAQAVITASSIDGNEADSCQITIVDWVANLSELKVVDVPYASYLLGTEGDNLFYAIDRDLYVTSDGFKSFQFLSTLPEDMDIPKMLVTPFGYFVQCTKSIFKSSDLLNWTPSIAMNMKGLYHSLAFDWDPASQSGYLYAGEYSVNSLDSHSVYKGVFPAAGEDTWKAVLNFASLVEWENDPSILNAARHIHVVAVDPYTGHVWVGTGDSDMHSKLLYSDDKGETFKLVGMGSQSWRTLSIWFTEQYVYWNMDTHRCGQSIWRIPRSRFREADRWPCVTPELVSGATKVGINYYVT